jgi:DNA-binding CsgD family transcriptional regulator
MDLLERETELAALDAAVSAAASGRGSALLVEAPAGTGKTALLDATAAAAERGRVRTLRASGGELERDFAFGAVRQLFEPVLVGRSAAARGKLLGGSAALAGAVVDPVGAPVEAGYALLHALFWLVANLATEQPLLLIVDDLHWVDEASLRTLDYLSRRAAELPLLVVGATRPSEPGAHAELLDSLRSGVTVITPGALSATAVASLVRDARPGADAEVCAAYHEASAGNPLYLRELLQTVPDGGPDAVRAAVVPALGERILRRIGRVGREAPALAGALAVLGDGYPLAKVAALAELDPATAAGAARELVRIDILAGDEPAAFAHPVIRHAVYSELSAARRSSMHAAAAEALDGIDLDAVAAQLVVLPPAGSDAVATRLREAGHAALARGAPEVAVRRLRRALDEAAAAPPRPELLFELGRAEAAGRDPECVAHLSEAFATAAGALKPAVAVVLVEVLAGAGAWTEVERVLDEALKVAPEGSAERGYLLASQAIMWAGDMRFAERFFTRWEAYEEFARGDSWAALALSAVLANEAAMTGGSRDAVLAHARRATAGERLLAEHGGGSWATMQALMALVHVEALDEAEAWSAATAEAGRRTGSMLQTFGALAGQSWLQARRGDLIGADAGVATVLELASATGMKMWLTSLAFIFQDVIAERAAFAALGEELKGVELPPAFATTFAGGLLLDARARIALAHGHREAALAELRPLQPIFEALRIGPVASPWRSRLALALAPEDEAQASALAAAELELARAARSPRAIGVALRAAGTLAGDEALLRESLSVLQDTPAALERVYTRLELGALLRRGQRLAEAREHLTAAMDGARRCGAERTLQRVTDELVAAGARPRRAASTGRESLTPRELRIAELAAAGRSNAEIAQELFVSIKTVETHLSHVYGKLGLSGHGSRSALASALSSSSSS